MKTKLLSTLIIFLSTVFVSLATQVTVTDTDINAGDKIYWTADNTYILNGFVFVEDGAELHIEAGTVIKGKPGMGEDASALIIARGGKIYAEGTANNPIIFTAEADNPDDFTDIPLTSTGLWGGVIILGKARINTSAGEGQIEGIPSTESRGLYGGNDDADNSGVLRYVSIRHGGTNIGADNEINGLTLGAVGSATQIEHIEIFSNQDDGIEFFGGTVNVKNIVVAFCEDDGLDMDEGYRGKGQFLFVLQSQDKGDKGSEEDGGTKPEDGLPLAQSQFYNETYIGKGASSGEAKNSALHIRDNSAASHYNSIYVDFGASRAIYEIEDLESGADSRQRLENGDMHLTNNLWYNIGTTNALSNQDFVTAYLTTHNNWVEDPMLTGMDRTQGAKGLDPRPQPGSPAYTKALANVPEGDDFLVQTNFLGAFGKNDLWIKGWTLLDKAGFVASPTVDVNEINIPGIGSLDIYPNPVSAKSNIVYSIDKDQNVKIELYNLLGEKVGTYVNEYVNSGSHSVSFNRTGLEAGIYLLRMELLNKIITQKVVIN